MHQPIRNKPLFRDTTSIAGWLFADLFLGLIIVFMASLRIDNQPVPSRTPSPTSTYISTPTRVLPTKTIAAHTPTPEFGLDTTPLIFYIEIENMSDFLYGGYNSVAKRNLLIEVDKHLQEYKDRHAGLIITQGYHRTVSMGVLLADNVNNLLIENYPKIFNPDGTVMKTYWYSANQIHPSGTIKFEIYFFTN